jgi:hypothetical protein
LAARIDAVLLSRHDGLVVEGFHTGACAHAGLFAASF